MCAECNMYWFGEVQAHWTSSNLSELHPHKYSMEYGVLLHKFGVVQLYWTLSKNTLNLTHNAHWTSSDYSLTEKARCRDFFHTSLGWFDWTSSSLQGIQGEQGALCTGSLMFKHIEPHRNFSTYTFTEIVRYRDFILWLQLSFFI